MAPFMVIGTKIRKFLHLPGVRIVSDKEKCISCKKCNQKCPMGLNVAELVENQKPQAYAAEETDRQVVKIICLQFLWEE